MPTGDSIAHYQYRAKPASDSTWGEWTDIPAANAASYTATVPNAYTLYDIELRAAIADGTEGHRHDGRVPQRRGIRHGHPLWHRIPCEPHRNDPARKPGRGQPDLDGADDVRRRFTTAKYQVRYKPADASWPATTPFGWTDVTGSNRASSSYTLTGVDTGLNDIELRFVPNSSLTSAAAEVQATPVPVPAQTGLSATTSLVAREVDLSWDAQSAHQGANVNFQVRANRPTKRHGQPHGPMSGRHWHRGDADTDAHNETAYTIDGLDARRPYDFQLRLAIGGAGGPAIEVTNVRAGYQPRGLGAATGTNPGTIDFSWTLQTANQGSGAAFLTRAKPATGSWPSNPNTIFSATEPAGWRTVLDSDSDTFLHE